SDVVSAAAVTEAIRIALAASRETRRRDRQAPVRVARWGGPSGPKRDVRSAEHPDPTPVTNAVACRMPASRVQQ
ncbi:MAG TPA: hypothetical protein PLS95_18905, partial [Thermoanaerobaculales bacterium]|nr:hypothetical protein [Thermoanaerobaculales bacterium]